MMCPSCRQDEAVTVETTCLDPNEPGDVLRFSVCRNCDYGINDHTEGECGCVHRCEATVLKGGLPAFCDRPLDARGYCGHERSHVDG